MKPRPMMLLAGVVLAALAQSGAASEAVGPSQITVWDHTQSATSSSYFTPPAAAWGLPSSLLSPDNYRDGNAFLRLQVSDKPSGLPVDVQVCFWRHSSPDIRDWRYETCSQLRRFTSDGDYYIELGAVGTWWKKDGTFDWNSLPSVTRIMLKDAETQKLLMSLSCGGACWPSSRGELDNHVPISLSGELVFIRTGASLTPPASWRTGCPTSWNPLCEGRSEIPGPGGGSVPVDSEDTEETEETTDDDTSGSNVTVVVTSAIATKPARALRCSLGQC